MRWTLEPSPYDESHARIWIGQTLRDWEDRAPATFVASQKVAERAGLRREGVLRSYVERRGKREDCIIFSLLPGELEDGDRG